MKHWILKFNYAVEIGAHLAYVGHYKVTRDPMIRQISRDELAHRGNLRRLLKTFGEKPSPTLNAIFGFIGKNIQRACHYSPGFLLDLVARSMEVFAIFSYGLCAKLYPEQRLMFQLMVYSEEKHKNYFKRV